MFTENKIRKPHYDVSPDYEGGYVDHFKKYRYNNGTFGRGIFNQSIVDYIKEYAGKVISFIDKSYVENAFYELGNKIGAWTSKQTTRQLLSSKTPFS